MGEKIKNTGNELKNRWVQRMPRFFRMIVKIVTAIALTATTVNFAVPALGGVLYEWWSEVYTHILVGSICTLMICKLTVAGGYRELNPEELLRGKMGRHIQMGHDIDEQIDGEQPDIHQQNMKDYGRQQNAD